MPAQESPVPCFLAILAFFFPRVVLVLLAIATDYIGRAYHTALWPLLGFFFAPFTTLAYAVAINANGGVTGPYAALVVIAVLMDLGVFGSGAAARRRRNRG